MQTPESFRCPTCNARQEPSPECRRCKCDLTLLLASLQRCQRLYDCCLRSLGDKDLDAAEELAIQRWELAPDQDAARLLAITYLLQGRYQAAVDVGAND